MSGLRPMKRAVHFDFHTQAGIDNFGENFDAEKFAQQMADAHVTYVNVFARCNMGYSYYPTKVGVPYPGLKGNMLGDIVRACHKRNIGVTGYLNAGLNHELSAMHPEWLQMNKNGQIHDFSKGGNFFRTVCYNTGYFDHFISEIKEIIAEGVDGVFCDCFGLRPCYCPKCVSDMLAKGIDIEDDKAVLEFADSVRTRVMETTRAIVPENVRLFFNGSNQWGGKGINSHFEVECLPAAWGFDMFVGHAAYARSIYDEYLYMNGRFQISWGDFGGYKGKAAIENDFYDGLTQGATPMLGDHLHPADIAIDGIYRDLADIYERIEKYEKWTDGAKYISELAVLTEDSYLGASGCAAARMLSELKYDFDVVNTLGDFSGYKLLIIPDTIKFDDVLAAKIKSFLANGGKIISSGISGLTPDESGFALPEWSFDYRGKSLVAKTDLKRHDSGFTTYFELKFDEPGLVKMPYSAYDVGIKMGGGEGNTSLADEIDSYFDNSGWNGRHFIFYTPPRKKTGNSAMAINKEGNVAHVSFALFSTYAKSYATVYRVMLAKLLSKFLPDKLILADKLPITSRVTLTGCDEYKLLHVKVTYPEIRGKLGIIEEHTVLPAGRTVAVKGEYKTVALLPSETKVDSCVSDGYTYITLPEITGYDMFLLK